MQKHHKAKLCETKVENFGVKVGALTIFQGVNFTLNCGEFFALERLQNLKENVKTS